MSISKLISSVLFLKSIYFQSQYISKYRCHSPYVSSSYLILMYRLLKYNIDVVARDSLQRFSSHPCLAAMHIVLVKVIVGMAINWYIMLHKNNNYIVSMLLQFQMQSCAKKARNAC